MAPGAGCFSTPVQMKKNSGRVCFDGLVRPGDRDALMDALFAKTAPRSDHR